MAEEALTLEELALKFLTSLPTEERAEKQQEVNRFVLWYGKKRPINQITPTEVSSYAQWIAASTTDANKRLEPVRAMFNYAKKEKLLKASLAPYLRIKQTQSKSQPTRRPKQQITLTADDHAELKSQLAALEEERIRIAEEMRIAAADKDFRENAPLQAARERRDYIEARMQEIKISLATGVVIDQKKEKKEEGEGLVAKLGSKVVLTNQASGEKLTYTLVTKNEANPANGKISIVSPLGKAVLNQHEGAIIKVIAPAGELLYKIEKID